VNSQKENLTSGSNISVGNGSLEFATECAHNVALGERSMQNTLTGNYNTGIGNFALQQCQTNNNVSIGFSSGLSVINQVNTISIGCDATATQSNQCVIGDANLTEVKSSGVFTSNSGFKIVGGLNTQYLLADGTTTTSSGGSSNTSNIYLYNSNTTTLAPPGTSQIRFNNAVQSNATLIYISHLTRDGIDIDEFLTLINNLSIIYIQDQNSSLNYIKYSVTGTPTIVLNDYITIPVLTIVSGGTGTSNFINGHNIFMSIFTNTPAIDTRISAVETKTQNQSGISGTTTFTGSLVSGSVAITGGTASQILLGNGTTNSTALTSIANAVKEDTSNNILSKTSGTNLFLGSRNIAIGLNNSLSLADGNDNIILGSSSANILNLGGNNVIIGNTTGNNIVDNGCVAIGAGANCPGVGDNQIAIGAGAITTAANECCIGNASITKIVNLGNGICDIGSSTRKFKDAYLSGKVNGLKIFGTANSNISIGDGSLPTLSSSSIGNVAIGENSMASHNIGYDNCSIGRNSLYNNNSIRNVAIGAGAGYALTTQQNTISIGSDANAEVSNQCYIGDANLIEVKTKGLFNGSGFKTPTGTNLQVLLANGSIDNNLFKLAPKNWDVVPSSISNGSMAANSWDYYINEQVPFDMYINKIRVQYITAGSDNSKFAIYRGNDLTATLVAQTALIPAASISQPFTTITFAAEIGQNTYFARNENIVIAYSSSGTSTRISTVSIATGNTNASWYNTTESASAGGFPLNPRSKAGAAVGAFCCRLISLDVIPTNIIPIPVVPILTTPTLTSNTSSSSTFLVSSNSVSSIDYEPWKLFDNNNTGYYGTTTVFNTTSPYGLTNPTSLPFSIGSSTIYGPHVKIDLDTSKKFNYYMLGQIGSNLAQYSISGFKLYGSNDNSNFNLIDTRSNYNLVGNYGTWNPKITLGEQEYKHILLQITNSGGGSNASLTNMELGYE